MRGGGRSDGAGRVVITVDAAWGPPAITVDLPPGIEPSSIADAVLAACLLPSMRRKEPLELDGPVSARLRAGASVVQDVFCTWDRALRPERRWYGPTDVHTTEAEPVAPAGRGTAAYFTGGVDSFHTAVAHREELDALVYVHGFDVRLDDHRLRTEVSARLAEAAGALGLPLLEVVTDLQAFGDAAGVGWPDYHGAGLATIAHLLSSRFARVLIPATHTYAQLEGLGSHPLLDPLWSSEAVEIVHDGAAFDRIDKLRAIAEVPAAREHLRVCWENRGGAYNCGRCEKCVRTGVAVRIAGLEGRFSSVPPPSLRQVAGALPTGRASAWRDLQGELRRTGANPRLARAVDVALARHRLSRWPLTQRWVR